MTAARSCCTGRWPRRPPAWAPTPAAIESLMGPLVRDWDEIADLASRTAAAAAASAVGRPLRPSRTGQRVAAWRRPSAVSGRGRCWRAWPPTRCCRSTGRRRRRSRWCCSALGHSVGWPVARGGSQAITEALAGVSAVAGRRDRDRQREVSSLADLPPARRGAVRRDAAPAARDRRRRAAVALPRGRSAAFRYGPGVFKLDYALDGPCRGRPRSAAAPAPCTSAARSRRSPRRRRGRSAAGIRSGRSCWSRSRACSIRPARPTGATRCGRTATSPTASTVDMTRRDRGADRALRARLPRSGAGARGARAGRDRGRRTRTTSAATSTAALADLRQVLARPVPRISPVRDAQPAALPLLVLDAARRRRPRHVRLPRRPRGTVNNWCLAPIIHHDRRPEAQRASLSHQRSPRATVMGSPLMPLAPSEQRKAIVCTISATVGVRPAAYDASRRPTPLRR